MIMTAGTYMNLNRIRKEKNIQVSVTEIVPIVPHITDIGTENGITDTITWKAVNLAETKEAEDVTDMNTKYLTIMERKSHYA